MHALALRVEGDEEGKDCQLKPVIILADLSWCGKRVIAFSYTSTIVLVVVVAAAIQDSSV